MIFICLKPWVFERSGNEKNGHFHVFSEEFVSWFILLSKNYVLG